MNENSYNFYSTERISSCRMHKFSTKKERKNELKLCKHSHQPTHQCPIATLHI